MKYKHKRAKQGESRVGSGIFHDLFPSRWVCMKSMRYCNKVPRDLD